MKLPPISRRIRNGLAVSVAILTVIASGTPLRAQAGGDPPPELDRPGGTLWVNAGADQALQEKSGRIWLPDAEWLVVGDGRTFARGAVDRQLLSDPTIPDPVFLQGRQGISVTGRLTDIGYSIPVHDARYEITLYFAETCADCVGSRFGGQGCATCERVFDVQVEELAPVRHNPADAGLEPPDDGKGKVFAASELRFEVQSVPDGKLEILIDYIDRGAPTLKAMRITRPLSALEVPGSSLYLNVAGPELIDRARRVWTPDLPYLVRPDREESYPRVAVDLSGLGDPFMEAELFRSERWSTSRLQYRIPAIEDVYQVSLFFAEMCIDCVSPRLGGKGPLLATRIFAVDVEGDRIEAFNPADSARPPDLDFIGETRSAVRLDFLVHVTDGVLDIGLAVRPGEQISPGYPILNAIAVSRPEVEILRLDEPDLAGLSPDDPAKLYLLLGRPGETVEVVASDRAGADGHRLYMRWDEIPDRRAFDEISAGTAERQVLNIPTLRRQDCLILLLSEGLEQSTEVLVLATNPGLRLGSMSPDSARPSTASTVVSGLGFTSKTEFFLQAASGEIISPTGTTVVSPTRAELEFDLSRARVGRYTLLAAGPEGDDALEDAFELREPIAPQKRFLSYELRGFGVFRVGELSRVTLAYRNTGAAEVPAPLFKVSATEGTRMGLRADGALREGVLQVLGVNPGGVAGRLPPGPEREIHIYFIADRGEELRFEVSAFTPAPDQVADFSRVPRPPGLSPEQWNTLGKALREFAGETWTAYGSALASVSTRLHRRGDDPSSVKDLFHFLSRMALNRPSSALVGQVRDANTLEPRHGLTVVALLGGVPAASAVTNLHGYYNLDWLKGGQKYEIAVDQHTIVSRVDGSPFPGQMPPIGGDLTAADFLVASPGGLVGAGCANCDETGLPTGALLPPDDLFSGPEGYFLIETSSIDPNEKKGPRKPSTPKHEFRICPEDTELEYQISFLNTGEGAARRVEIVDEVDLGVFEPLSFEYKDVIIPLGTYPMTSPETDGIIQIYSGGFFTFGYFATGSSGADHFVEYNFDYNPGTGLLTCILQVVDPVTLLPPLDPGIGILEPGAIGHIAFSLSPKSGELDGGAEIKNRGSIQFDTNAPIITDYYINVFSECLPGEPNSPSPPDQTVPAVPVGTALSWEAEDADDYDVYFWEDGASPSGPVAANRIAQGLVAQTIDPGILEIDTLYHWQVVANNVRGPTPGPVWDFRTEVEIIPELEFSRGDVNSDDTVDIADPVVLLFFLYAGGATPGCQKAADANDSGVVDQADVVSLLGYLFLAQSPPASPFPLCGLDPTPDALSCEAFGACP